jgi:long-chain acyl-CoA synthetase
VYPEDVEYRLRKSAFIDEVVVYAAEGSPGGPVITAEVFPDADAVRRVFGEVDAAGLQKIIDRETDKANGTMPPHMRVRRVVLRDIPFEKTTTKKIRR